MDTLLAKYRRDRFLALLLGLLLSGNELAHLCYHEHLCHPTAGPSHWVDRKPDGAPALSAEPHHLAEASAEEFFCPGCSSVIDLLCSPASVEPQVEALPAFVIRRDPASLAFRFSSHHQPRAPPRG